MPSDAPNAAWHPAFMPHTVEAVPKSSHAAAVDATETAASISHQEHDPAAHDRFTFDVEHDQHDDSGVDAWFPEYDGGSALPEDSKNPLEEAGVAENETAAVPEPAQERALEAEPEPAAEQASEPPVEPVPQQAPEPAPEPIPETTDVPAPASTAQRAADSALKHQSTVSFTRTVSNDVNWDAEDEDPEWDLPRTNTDPFKFMPESDRTNSFPVVPPLESREEGPEPHIEQLPLGSSQAMDIIHEVDNEVNQEEAAVSGVGQSSHAESEKAPNTADAWDLGPEEDQEGHSFFDGAEGQTSWEGPSERFEEGVPLIPHQEANNAPAAHQQENETKDPFAETNDDEDDDFFSSAKPSAAAEAQAESAEPPAFERKSTMQVLQKMNLGDLSQGILQSAVAIPEDVEEDDAAATEIKGVEVHGEQNGTAQKLSGEGGGDLAAQWAAALADDDDDVLLLDESALETKETKELDPAAFFGDDDEGFLEDDADASAGQPAIQPAAQPPAPQTASVQQQQSASRYLPQGAQSPQAQQPQQQANPYLPSATFAAAQPVVPSPYASQGPAPQQFPVSYGYGAPPQQQQQQQQQPERAPLTKAQSFADKSKGGYHSPYDLPMDVVKPPRKRQSMQQLPRANQTASAPPPRSTSLQGASPLKDSLPPAPPPSVAQSGRNSQPPPAAASAQPAKHEAFFEDLPMLPKPRPASRHSLPSPSQTSPYGPPVQAPPLQHPPQRETQPSPYAPPPTQPQTLPSVPPPSSQYAPPATAPPQQISAAQPPNSEIAKLVAPPRVSPYAPLQAGSLPQQNTAPPAPSSTRYSPSPNQHPPSNGTAVAAQSNRYSPAPPPRVPSTGAPPVLPHQPRTSSPLAHFEMTYDKPRASSVGHPVIHGDSHGSERRSSSSLFEPRLNRVPSLPPTQEEEEDNGPQRSGGQQYPPAPTSQSSQSSQYSPLRTRHTPPPQANAYGQSTLSPPKRILNYAPQSDLVSSPPVRSQTQSPGALYGNRSVTRPVDPVPRPSSVHEVAPQSRPRGASLNLNLVPPTDGTETDPLQRWKGAPVFTWGVGGAFVSSFPQDVPRYGINQALPMIHRAPGEVQLKNIKELQPLEERLAKFPGPLKGKSKKKEVLAWLTSGIEELERSLPSASFASYVPHEDKRLEERVLLWKILRLFIEYDGVLEGSPAVEKAVRDVLSPYTADELATTSIPTSAGLVGYQDIPKQAQSDAVDSSVIEQIRKNLLLGDKEKAAWDAVDKRLWGHAFLIAGAASRDLFKKVAQEFVRKEVNTPGLNNESLAALYEVLSGNHEECVDELVPVHARAGLQLMTTQASTGQSKDELAGLDKWRETLCLILSNRSIDDIQAINSLGNLLSGYGRAEAAHACFLFSRNVTVFGGLDDPAANFVLLGADHKRQVDSFANENDAVLLSEVYEYGLSLTGSAAGISSPHLAAYKLQHAMTLAEYGLRDKALQYCEAIVSAMGAQTRRSPYYHPLLEAAVEDLMKRLKAAPKEESNSWIPKPSMNKVSDSMWNRFNKFVAGDENEGPGAGVDGDGGAESGPFARIAGGTPTISRPTSAGGGATGMEMFGGQNSIPGPVYGAVNGAATLPPAPLPATRAASRYAPGVSQPVAASPVANPYEPNAGYSPVAGGVPPVAGHNAYQPSSSYTPAGEPSMPRRSSEYSAGYNPSYAPSNAPAVSAASAGYSPNQSMSRESSYIPVSQTDTAPPSAGYVPASLETPTTNPYTPTSDSALNGSPYAPLTSSAPASQEEKTASAPESGYEPPSYGYEPPPMSTSFEPVSDEPGTSQNAEEGGATSANANGGYEPPSFQPYSYEPPSYEAEAGPAGSDASDNAAEEKKPKKKSFMDDDEDDIPALKKPAEKTKEEKDRENAELFRKAAEEDAKRAEAEKEAKAKKGWGLTSWWASGKKDTASPGPSGEQQAPKAVRANLGEKSSFYFDPELKRWVNKNASPEDQAARATPPPPPPRSAPQSKPPSATSTPPPPMATATAAHPPPPRPTLGSMPPPTSASAPNLVAGAPPPPGGAAMARTSSNASVASGPPSRPATSMSDANSIDDLLGATPGPRKAGAKKGRKSGRYVDVMAK